MEPVVAEETHDVPEQRPAADCHHRLGAILGLLAHPRTLTTAENDDVHEAITF